MRAIEGWVLDERKFLDEEEQALLLGCVRRRVALGKFKRGPWLDWFLVELALATGLRVGEMSQLSCSDLLVGLDRAGVLVRRGKGGKSRFVRVSEGFCRVVEDFFNWKRAAGEPVDDEAPVFRSPTTAAYVTVRSLQKRFARSCRRAGVTGHSIHHCRHTYASELLRSSGGNLRIVQKQLGHAKVTTTQIYADVFDADMDDAVEALYDCRPAATQRTKKKVMQNLTLENSLS